MRPQRLVEEPDVGFNRLRLPIPWSANKKNPTKSVRSGGGIPGELLQTFDDRCADSLVCWSPAFSKRDAHSSLAVPVPTEEVTRPQVGVVWQDSAPALPPEAAPESSPFR